MFFNSFERKMKKMFKSLNPAFKYQIFPRGENEFIYVARLLEYKFPKRDIVELIKLYASVYTYFLGQQGNAFKTFAYTERRAKGILNESEVITMIALASFNIINAKSNSINGKDLMDSIEISRMHIVSYLNNVMTISKNSEYFLTRNSNVGSISNPVLVNGIGGVNSYIESIDFPNADKVDYERTKTMYFHIDEIDFDYAIDEYTVKNVRTGEVIAELWFNIYGAQDCKFPPDNFSFK